ncbi:uncharacterized protein LOC123565885 [Mercenaria mercenaria]|uniref:uncharacterized protein LOC123565885 n=1 Tax=Mercenaria mercenaria TaxID=6596 RepID=UPI00234F60AF|nr:uncharacterized protein LOC123565885 [Mercenaria mercenaria]XP_045215591.2 uncharacterized protein LOC123565885 [Mercenaria mercenaria]XP_045215592.2 uncharacterized protein LOC123565885 [Mercenaria mercenaria]
MPMVEFIWVLLGLMVYLLGAIVQATHTSLLQELLNPVDNRLMYDQKRSHHNGHSGRAHEASFPSECCPTVTRAIAPLGGLSRDNSLLQLFRDSNTIQKFYETTCAHGVKNRPCNFVDQSEWRSVCEQKHTYTYAIVKDFNVTEPYRIDYMKINSGCSCKIIGPARPPSVSLEEEIFNELESGLLEKK